MIVVTILMWIVFAILGFIVLLIGIGVVIGVHVARLLDALPWMKWLTLEDLRTDGWNTLFCRFALIFLHDKQHLEARLVGPVPPEKEELVQQFGFHPLSVQYFEFRLVKRGGRRRRKLRIDPLPDTYGLVPA